MAEKLYTIPVNDAFDADCECPVCEMYMKLFKINKKVLENVGEIWYNI